MIKRKTRIQTQYRYGFSIRDVRGCREYNCQPEYLAAKLGLDPAAVEKMPLAERLSLARELPGNTKTFTCRPYPISE